MVAPQEEEIARILDFVGHEQADGLETELAPVDVVPQKEIVGLGWVLAVIEKPQQVGVLAVDVACVWRGLSHQHPALPCQLTSYNQAHCRDLP